MAWITPIMGTEINVESILDSNISHKLVLLAKSLPGYKNIIALTSNASLENAWKIPKIVFEDIIDLKNEKGDLEIVCLSWPITWEIPFLSRISTNKLSIIKSSFLNLIIFWEFDVISIKRLMVLLFSSKKYVIY